MCKVQVVCCCVEAVQGWCVALASKLQFLFLFDDAVAAVGVGVGVGVDVGVGVFVFVFVFVGVDVGVGVGVGAGVRCRLRCRCRCRCGCRCRCRYRCIISLPPPSTPPLIPLILLECSLAHAPERKGLQKHIEVCVHTMVIMHTAHLISNYY